MTFNKDARVERSRVRRGGGAGTGVAVGGGTLLVLFLLSQLLGVDLTGLAPATDPGVQGDDGDTVGSCTGEQANTDIDCRMSLTYESLDDYWYTALPQLGAGYVSPEMYLASGTWQTGCGTASSAMGPFYCPPDQSIYVDTSFFEVLTGQLGAEGGPLAEMYVVAHEWGHHIQNLSGTMDGINRTDTGPTSDGVRLELQADCFAGAWAQNAQSTEDADGTTLLEPFTQDQLASAMDAAATVGDDHIQSSQGGSVNPEQWTHGSSESRQQWFLTGYENGPSACDTFASGADL
ncbi:neutral zinc metallopeptidase [Pseudactinotalea sp.]|uniref:KPN_02809 family neutral zinc metallopeptidase n=1 Tax=Pseudactinotalea sp. TaxID=1926260 RepID=UPI003B3BD8B7